MLGTKVYSGFDPRSLGACALWLDAADSNAFTFSSGSNVSAWRDKSGNSNTSTVIGTPIRSASAINGRPGITTTTSDAFFYDPLTNPANTSTLSLYIVATLTAPANFGRLWSTGLRSDGTDNTDFARDYNFVIYKPDTGVSLTLNRNVTVLANQSTSSNTPFLVEAHFDGTNGIMYYNGGLVGSTESTGTFLFDKVGLGRNCTATSVDAWSGAFAEVILLYKQSSPLERQAIQGYLASKWGLSSNLPTVHPYRNATPFLRLFNPLDLSGLVVWLDAADETQITYGTPPAVTQLKDKGALLSSNNIFSCSATRISRGTLGNSLPTLSNAGGATTQVHGITGNSPMTYAMVARVNSTSQIYIRGNLTSGGGDGYGGSLSFGISNNRTQPFLGINQVGTLVIGTATTSNTHIVIGSWDGTFGRIHDNGALTGTSASNTLNQASATTSLDFANNELGEFMIFNRTLSESDRQVLESYFAQKWGLVGSTPSDHPARLAPALAPQFNPLLVGNCTLWLDAADQSTLTLSGSNVTQWNDKSGAGGNGTATNTPVLSRAVFGGRQSILFASNAYFSGATANTGTTLTSFAVVQLTTLPSAVNQNMRILSLATPSNNDWDSDARVAAMNVNNFTVQNTIGVYRSTAQWASATSTVSSNTPYIVSSILNGSVATSHLNGTLGPRSLASTGTFAITSYAVGNQCVPTTEFLRGYLGEVLLFTSALTTTQRQQVEGYLARKWGLLTSLPSNHPYRVTPLF
jgi:hypothetical protein